MASAVRRQRLTGVTLVDDREQSHQFIFDLDPPKGRRQRAAGMVLWITVVVILIIPLRVLLIDEGTASHVGSAPSPDGIAELCSQFTLPSVLREFADLAYPIWNNVCDIVRR